MTDLRAAKAAARRLASRSFRAAQATNLAKLAWEDRRHRTPVVVHQMGKVGSQAIVRSLEEALGGPVFHTHYLTPAGIAWAAAVYRRDWDPARDPDHLWDSLHLRRRLDGGRPTAPWKVVTLVRDPVARNLSSFFQVAGLQFGIDLDQLGADAHRERAVAELTRLFLDRFDEHELPARWFDDELRAVFDLDVLDGPFPARGWSRHVGPRADVVVLKLERLAEVADEALRAHLGVAHRPVPEVNVGGDKAYGELYRAFTSRVRLPAPYVERMYSSRMAEHFYGSEERAQLAARWTGGR